MSSPAIQRPGAREVLPIPARQRGYRKRLQNIGPMGTRSPALTAALFEIGKLLIGLYIGKQSLESTYGAAASLVVLLIWVYYSSQIVLMGAEFTRVHAKRYASPKTDEAISKGQRSERLPVDPLQMGVRRSPISGILLALGTGWLFSRWRDGRGLIR